MAEPNYKSGTMCSWEAHSMERQEIARRLMTGSVNRRWFDFIWIVWSLFFFIEPIERHERHFWIIFLIFYAIFIALYCGIVLSRTKIQVYLSFASMAILAVCFFPFVNSALSALIFVAAFAPFTIESVSTVLVVLGAVCSIAITEGLLFHVTPWTWGMTAAISLIVGIPNLFTAQKVRANTKLNSAYEEIEHLAQIAERERIARDLHDVLGHTLSVVVLKSELAGRLMESDPARARAEIRDVEQTARKALGEVREAIRGYRSEGLAAEMERARQTLEVAGVTLICESKPPSLSPAEETVLSLAVREAVTNIVRHSHASRCTMRFTTENGRAILTVEDDGRGNIRQEGNGLRGMRERIESLGGRFHIDDQQGTRLNIEIPARTA
jgi:two-component system sensor histidine kinase DesK